MGCYRIEKFKMIKIVKAVLNIIGGTVLCSVVFMATSLIIEWLIDHFLDKHSAAMLLSVIIISAVCLSIWAYFDE